MALPELTGTLARRMRPSAEMIAWCERELTCRGWVKHIVGEANFRAGAKAWAYAHTNDMGLIVLGPNGTGKTTYLDAITRPYYEGVKKFCLKIEREARFLSRDDYGEYVDSLVNYHLYLDDLGAEKTGIVYGKRVEQAMDALIMHVLKSRNRAFVSTNLYGKPGEGNCLLDRYGARIDCLRDRLVPVVFTGKSIRQWLLPL